MTDNAAVKEAVISTIENNKRELEEISKKIWKQPELAFEETEAHKLLTQFLENQGFDVIRSYVKPTAFKATYSNGEGATVCVFCEYDALPEIGHGCGHNLIAEAGIGAAIATKAVLEKHLVKGTIICLGSPAEERFGGKLDLIRANALDVIDVAMMAHPLNASLLCPNIIGVEEICVTFTGKAVHAAGCPWEGINALDAAVSCYNNLSMLRQQVKPNSCINCVILEGGVKANIIPGRSVLEIYVRAPTMSDMELLRGKVLACIDGAAGATQCKVEYKLDDRAYQSLKHNHCIADVYRNHATEMGDNFSSSNASASTDMGNVSQKVPSIHPMFDIGSEDTIHSTCFERASGTAQAHVAAQRAAKAMAMTAVDILHSPELLGNIKKEFSESF